MKGEGMAIGSHGGADRARDKALEAVHLHDFDMQRAIFNSSGHSRADAVKVFSYERLECRAKFSKEELCKGGESIVDEVSSC